MVAAAQAANTLGETLYFESEKPGKREGEERPIMEEATGEIS